MTNGYAVRWLALSTLAVVAFVAVPPLLMPVARGNPDLPAAAAAAVTSYWSAGVAVPDQPVQDLLDGWRDYHWAKAVLALLAVVALLGCAAVIPRCRAVARWAYRGGAAFAMLLVMANVQGALAPLASLLSLLPEAGGSSGLETALSALAADVSAGATSPVGAAILTDFAAFHAVLAVMAGLLGLGLLVIGVREVVRRHGWLDVSVPVLLGLGALTIAAANASTALSPTPALQSFLDGLLALR